MSISTMKKILLAGTALVAFAAFGTQAQATTYTLTGATTWGEGTGSTGGPATGAGAGGNVVLVAATPLTITNDQTANDGSGLNTFNVGSITDTGAIAGPAVTINSGSANNLAVTISSVGLAASTSQAAFTVKNDFVGANSVTVGVTGAFSTTGALTLANADTTAAAVALTIGGDATVGGATSVTGGTNAGNTTTLTLNGAGTNTFTGGLTLTNGAAGHAGLNVTGSAAQTVAGTVAGNGDIIVDNANGATFSGTVTAGTVTIDKGAGNSSATFKNTVAAPITLGHAAGAVNGVTFGAVTAGDTNTVTFDSTGGSFGITGAIAGANATQTNNIDVVGGHTVTLNTASTSNLNNLVVSGTGTNFTMGAAVTVANTSIGSGATVTTGANALTSIVDGASNGVGTLAVTGNSTVTGNIGATHALAGITVGTGDTLTATGATIKATTTTLTTTGTLTLSNAVHALTTNIVDSANGQGTINTGTNAVTESGDIGTSTFKVGALNIGAAGSLTTTGNLYVNTITNGAAGSTLELNGTSAQIVSGTIDQGILTVGDGTNHSNVTFDGAIGGGTALASATVAANATSTFNEGFGSTGLAVTGGYTNTGTTNFETNATIGGALVNSGTLVLGYDSGAALASQPVVTVNSTTATNGAYSFGVTSHLGALVSGKIVSAGALSLSNTASTVAVNVDPSAGFIADKSVTLIASGTGQVAKAFAGASDAALHSVTSDNSALYDFQYVRGDYATAGTIKTNINTLLGNNTSDNDIVLVATRNAISTLGSAITNNDSAVNTALTTIGNNVNAATGGANVTAFQGTLASAGTATQVHNLLQSVTPTVDGGAETAALTVGAETQDVANTRLAALRDGDTKSGVAAGATANGVSMWVEGYGQHANQDERDGVNGFSSNTWGGAVGADTTTLLDKAIVGVALNYGHSKVDSDNANTTTTDLGNYGVNLYGTYDLGDRMFVGGQAGYAYNTIDTDRHNVGGAGGPTATGSTHSDEYLARADVGRSYPMDGGLTLTPDVSAAYTHLATAGYSELGAGGLDQVVNGNSLSALNLGFGGTASWKIKDADDNLLKPSLHVGYAYDAIGDKVETTSAFAGAPGVNFITNGASPERSTFDVGAKAVYVTKANWDVSATYDFQIKQDYTSHTGELRATAHF